MDEKNNFVMFYFCGHDLAHNFETGKWELLGRLPKEVQNMWKSAQNCICYKFEMEGGGGCALQ